MTLREIILSSRDLDDDLVVYAKRIDGLFRESSEAVLLNLTEAEQEMKVDEVSKLKCPGFDYCLEMFLIQEMMEDLDETSTENMKDDRVARILYYMEYDA